jgi:hypothetical protein
MVVEAAMRRDRGVKQDDEMLGGNGYHLTVVRSARRAVLDIHGRNR